MHVWGFPGGSVLKNPPANAGATGDSGSIPGSGRSPREGNDNTLQYSCLYNSMDRGAWWAAVHRVTESDMTEHECRDTHVSICTASLTIREIQMRTPARSDYTLTRMTIIQRMDDANCWQAWGASCPLLVENSTVKAFFMELNVCSPDGISETEYLARINENTCPHQGSYVIVHSSSVCDRQTRAASQMSVNR